MLVRVHGEAIRAGRPLAIHKVVRIHTLRHRVHVCDAVIELLPEVVILMINAHVRGVIERGAHAVLLYVVLHVGVDVLHR